MKCAISIIGLVLLLSILGSSIALADEPSDSNSLAVNISIEGDNTTTDVHVNGDNSAVVINGKIPFETYSYSSVTYYDDKWMKDSLTSLGATIDQNGAAIIQLNDNISLVIDTVAMLISISEKQREFNTQAQDNLNGLTESVGTLYDDATVLRNKFSDLLYRLDRLDEKSTLTWNEIDNLNKLLVGIDSLSKERTSTLQNSIDESTRQSLDRESVLQAKLLALEKTINENARLAEVNNQQSLDTQTSLIAKLANEERERDSLNNKVNQFIIGICSFLFACSVLGTLIYVKHRKGY